MRTSKGEQKVIDILKQEGLIFIREYYFKDFKTLRGGIPRYDFAVLKKNGDIDYLIEYDGEQHFNRGSITNFKKFQYRTATDRQKNAYCLNHNIPLYRIPYTDYDSIKTIDDIKSYKYRVTTKFHNDNLRFTMDEI